MKKKYRYNNHTPGNLLVKNAAGKDEVKVLAKDEVYELEETNTVKLWEGLGYLTEEVESVVVAPKVETPLKPEETKA